MTRTGRGRRRRHRRLTIAAVLSLTLIVALGVLVGFGNASTDSSVASAAAAQYEPSGDWRVTQISDSPSAAHDINEDGIVAGAAGGDLDPRAVLWGPEGVMYLETPDGLTSVAAAINNLGQAGGTVSNSNFGIVGAVWDSNGALRWVGSFAGHVADLNDLGQAVGGGYEGFVWDETNGIRLLPRLDNGFTSAAAINNDGLIVGQSDGSAVLWENGELVVLPTLEGGSAAGAYAVNEEGTAIVGHSRDAADQWHAVMWVRSDTANESPSAAEYQYGGQWEITDLGRLDGQYAGAEDINESGLIVGYMQDASGDYHGFVWDDGERALLPPLAGDTSSYAIAINDGGQIVGASSVPSPYVGRAVMWSQFTDPADMLAQLAADVADLGPGTSLAATVAAAQASLARGNTQATCEILQAFVKQVEALAGKKIPPATAEQLIADATTTRDTIGC